MENKSIQKLGNKKEGLNKLLFLGLAKFYEDNYNFPDDVEFLKNELLYSDFIAVQDIYKNSRTIERYRSEIRSAYDLKKYTVDEETQLKHYFIQTGFSFKNAKDLERQIIKRLKDNRTEIANQQKINDISSSIIKNLEEVLFLEINKLLSEEEKVFIGSLFNSIENHENYFEYFTSGLGSKKKENYALELAILNILEKIDFKKFAFLGDVHPYWYNFYINKFHSLRFGRRKNNVNSDAYALIIFYLKKRHQESLDFIIDYFRLSIVKIKQHGSKKVRDVKESLFNSINDISKLYDITELMHDNPKEIPEISVYPHVPESVVKKIIDNKNKLLYTEYLSKNHALNYYNKTHRKSILNTLINIKFLTDSDDITSCINIVKKYKDAQDEEIPNDAAIDNILSTQALNFIKSTSTDDDKINKKAYELELLKILSIKLNNKQIWIQNSKRFNNPSLEKLEDFTQNKKAYCDELNFEPSATKFIETLKDDLNSAVSALDDNFLENDKVNIITKKEKPWIKVSRIKAKPVDPFSKTLKERVFKKWGSIPIMDVLNEVELKSGFIKNFVSVGKWSTVDKEDLRKRLLLCIFGVGTNFGMKRTSQASIGSITFEELRHTKRLYLSVENLREAIRCISNDLFKKIDKTIWGELSTILCSDSTQLSSFEDNMITKYHPRYKENGVMIYWHVSKNYICVFSQLKDCTSSEVASMLHGVLNHDTNLKIDGQYVDTHGKSDLGFALSRMLNFELLPRIKNIGSQKIYVSDKNFKTTNINQIVKGSIDFDLIEQHYDEILAITAALKYKKTTADSITRQFNATNYQSSLFKAFRELGRAQRSIFLCKYLSDENLRAEISAGLNITENWNSMAKAIHYADNIDIRSNDVTEQEVSVLCVHFLQLCIVYLNFLLIQNLAGDDEKLKLNISESDSITPTFYFHINLYGAIDLSFNSKLNI